MKQFIYKSLILGSVLTVLPVVTQSMNLINYFRRSTIRFFT